MLKLHHEFISFLKYNDIYVNYRLGFKKIIWDKRAQPQFFDVVDAKHYMLNYHIPYFVTDKETCKYKEKWEYYNVLWLAWLINSGYEIEKSWDLLLTSIYRYDFNLDMILYKVIKKIYIKTQKYLSLRDRLLVDEKLSYTQKVLYAESQRT